MELMKKIIELQNSEIKDIVDDKIIQFKHIQQESSYVIFNELCFCILTANFNAKRAIMIQNEIGEGFVALDYEELRDKLQELGHRFYNRRAEFIVLAREYKDSLKDILFDFDNDFDRRDFLVKNVKGIGMKEASHFLRNIGFLDVAILDFHIIDLLVENCVIDKPKVKGLTVKSYVEIENKLQVFCDGLNLTQGELDFYLWYVETGSILK